MNAIKEALRSNAAQCISTICADAYLAPGSHTASCIPAQDNLNFDGAATSSSSSSSSLSDREGFGTWLVQDGEPILLIRGPAHAIVFIPSCDMCYTADPVACIIRPECPPYSVFRAQFFMEGGCPRVLVFDAVSINGQPLRGIPPEARYGRIDPAWFGGVVSRQWCGFVTALRTALADGSFKVPHAVRGVVVFTEDPMALRVFGAQ